MERKKVLTAVAVGAATVAAGVGASQVHADSVTVTKQVIGDETKITTTTTKTVDSQEQINQTKQKVSDQKKVTAQASSTVDKDSQQVSQDKSNVAHWESVKKDATPANISANKQAQASQQSKISADKLTISGQQKNVDSAQSSVNSAQSNLNDKKAAQASAQTAYNNAENDYNKAKDEVANSQQAIANQQNQVNQDKQTVANDQSKVTDLTNQVSNDQNKVTADENDINNVGQKAQADRDKLNNDESSLSAAQKQLNSDQQKLSDLQNQSKYIPVAPQLPSSYVKNVVGNPDSTNKTQWTDDENAWNVAEAELEKIEETNDPSLNYYVDASNLSNSDMKLLNERLIAYLNQFRKQAGMAPLEYNSEAAQIAAALAHTWDADNDNVTNPPLDDPNEFNTLGKYNLSSPGFGTSGTVANDCTHITMNQLIDNCYRVIYNTIVADFDPEFGHMHELLPAGTANSVLVGLAVDKKGNLHYLNIDLTKNPGVVGGENIPNDPSIFAGKSETVPNVSDLQNQIASAKQTVQNDQNQVNSLTNQVNADKAQLAQDTPSGLQQQLANDKAKLAQDTQALNNAKQALANDQQTLQNDENTLSQMQQNANDPQAYLNSMANKVSTAKTALENANNAVAQAQQAYDAAEANLQKQQQILSNDEAQLAKDEATLKNLQQQAQDYQNADQNLANAQKQLASDLAKYNQDHQTYLDDLQVLNELETELLNEEKTYTTTSVQWIKNPRPTTTSEIGNQYVLNSRPGNSMVKFGGVDEVQAAEVPGLRRSNRNNGLPNTGDSQNSAATVVGLLGLGLAGILSMFGLAERKKRGL